MLQLNKSYSPGLWYCDWAFDLLIDELRNQISDQITDMGEVVLPSENEIK